MYDEHVQRGVSGVEVVSDGEGYATNFCTQVIIILLQLVQNAAFGGKIFNFDSNLNEISSQGSSWQ